jgi:hypothetical protein
VHGTSSQSVLGYLALKQAFFGGTTRAMTLRQASKVRRSSRLAVTRLAFSGEAGASAGAATAPFDSRTATNT